MARHERTLKEIEEIMSGKYVEDTRKLRQQDIVRITQLVNDLKIVAKKIQNIQYKQGLIEHRKRIIEALEVGLQYNIQDQKQLDEIYEEGFKILNEIGKIIRGEKRDIELKVFEEDSKGNLIGVYSKVETDINLKTPESQQVDQFTQSLKFSLTNLKKEKQQVISKSFQNYYQNFKNVALNNKDRDYNVGHIQEAFDRHWSIYNSRKTPSNDNFVPTNFKNKRDIQIVYILLYYAKNSISWLHGGDNAWRQVKGGKGGNINQFVADFLTIENAINKVLKTWTDDGKISNDFKKIFNTTYKDGLDSEIDKNIETMTDKEINNIGKTIKNLTTTK